MLDSLLVGLGLGVVLVLGSLVRDSVASGLETVARVSGCSTEFRRVERCLPSADTGVVVLGDVLVGLLGSTAGGALDLVRDVVAGVLDGIHDD